MDVLLSLQGSQLETDDPTISYMLQVCTFLCNFFYNIHNFLTPEVNKCTFFVVVGMGKTLQVPWAGFPSLHECCHATTASLCSA